MWHIGFLSISLWLLNYLRALSFMGVGQPSPDRVCDIPVYLLRQQGTVSANICSPLRPSLLHKACACTDESIPLLLFRDYLPFRRIPETAKAETIPSIYGGLVKSHVPTRRVRALQGLLPSRAATELRSTTKESLIKLSYESSWNNINISMWAPIIVLIVQFLYFYKNLVLTFSLVQKIT